MARYQVFVETSAESVEEGGYLAHVPELVGCVARAKTREEVLDKTREAIRAFHALLRKHGRPAPAESEPLDLQITELDPKAVGAYVFPADYVPLSDPDLDDLCQRAALSRQELLDTLAALPAGALDWRVEPDGRPVRQILAHVANSDVYYASRLKEGGLEELYWRLQLTRPIVLGALQELPPAARGKVTHHDGEEWTPRKAARRLLEHEQEHLAELRDIAARHR